MRSRGLEMADTLDPRRSCFFRSALSNHLHIAMVQLKLLGILLAFEMPQLGRESGHLL